MAIKIFAPKGTNDILPEQIPVWEKVEQTAKRVAKRFGYREIRTPEFESTSLFVRGVGDSTDIVQKEMYTFMHRDKESLTLKPEGTSPVVRAFIENGMASSAQPVKLFYLTNCFRCENPQKGRYRQFHQFGVEALGAEDSLIDAEIIALANMFIEEMGIKNIILHINSVGCPTCRKKYYEVLRGFLKDRLENLCDDCKSRYEKNPMRIIDCKNEHCKELLDGVPMMIDNLCDECKEHFDALRQYLDAIGIKYEVDPTIVRGLDYYTKTAFEFIAQDLGSQSTLCGGGRYNGLCDQIGGPKTAGIGFALGIERLLLILEAQNLLPKEERKTDIYIASLGDDANRYAMHLANALRKKDMLIQTDVMKRSLKAQMKYSDKINARYVFIVGENELQGKKGILRNMTTKEQVEVPLDEAEKTLFDKVFA